MKRGKMLDWKPRRRGGRLAAPKQRREERRAESRQLAVVAAVGCLIFGTVAGFAWGLDRQLRGGVLLQRAEAMQRPDWVEIESLPDYVADAFLLVVDPGFREGGSYESRRDRSTLSRELVRDIHLLDGGLRGTARAMVMGPLLERRAGNRDILEFYLNRVYLGRTEDYPVYGLYHAAQEYFAKEPGELTLGEAASLAGLLLEPRIERPDERAGSVGIRRNEVLQALLAGGEITQQEYRDAVGDPLRFQPWIAELPMSRRIPTPEDTVVIRLPDEYLPQPVPDEAEGTE